MRPPMRPPTRMDGPNRFKLGLFCTNGSGGVAMTTAKMGSAKNGVISKKWGQVSHYYIQISR